MPRRQRTEHSPKARKTMIVALAALWRLCARAWFRRGSPCAQRDEHELLILNPHRTG
jgi:hypothetical protein